MPVCTPDIGGTISIVHDGTVGAGFETRPYGESTICDGNFHRP
jgi:hypothetical protein